MGFFGERFSIYGNRSGFFQGGFLGGNVSGFLGRSDFGGFEQFWDSFSGILEVDCWGLDFGGMFLHLVEFFGIL